MSVRHWLTVREAYAIASDEAQDCARGAGDPGDVRSKLAPADQLAGAVRTIRAARDAARTPGDMQTVRTILNEALDRFDHHSTGGHVPQPDPQGAVAALRAIVAMNPGRYGFGGNDALEMQRIAGEALPTPPGGGQ
jgi:hypothetical protein